MLSTVRFLCLLTLISLPAVGRAATTTIRHDVTTGAFPSQDMQDYWQQHVLAGGGQGPFTGYEGNNDNQWFLDTFTLPQGVITSPMLEIQVQALHGIVDNDALHLQTWVAGEYSTFLGDLLPPDPWGTNTGLVTFFFDLDALGITPSMNSSRELRVSVQDDTQVIYAQLTFTPEPSTFVLFALGTAAAVITGLRRRSRAQA